MRRTDPEASFLSPARPLRWPAQTIIEALSPCTLPERLERLERAIAERIPSVLTVLEDLVDPHNIAAILRTSDALGVGEVHVIDNEGRGAFTSTASKGAERWLRRSQHRSPAACAQALRARGFALYFADVKGTLSPQELAQVPRLALVLGNEHAGCTPELRAQCDGSFSIPMRGLVESYNVSVAAALALYCATQGRPTGLEEGEALELRARFLLQSVRAAEMVVERFVRDRSPATQD